MLHVEKLATKQESHWKVVLEGSAKGESDDFALDLHDIAQAPEIPAELMNELFVTLANQPNYGLSENIKAVIDPNGEPRSIQAHGLITFSTMADPDDKSFILLKLEEGTFHFQAASPKSLAIKLKNEEKRKQLLHQLINNPKNWYFVGFVMHYSPNYTVKRRNDSQEMFFSLEALVTEDERTLPLSWVFDLFWHAATENNYTLEADIVSIEDPNGKQLEEASYMTVYMSIDGNKLGLLLKIKGDNAIVLAITPERALTNIAEAERPLVHLADALAVVPEAFEHVRIGLIAAHHQETDEKTSKKHPQQLESEIKNWIYM